MLANKMQDWLPGAVKAGPELIRPEITPSNRCCVHFSYFIYVG
jgi:hypothetical protein